MTTLVQLENIHDSWRGFFTRERMEQLEGIEEQIGGEFTPKKEAVLRFVNSDLMEKKVIWLGQDPYFQPGVANGRSFQPSNLERWEQPFKQVSLKNIVRLVHASARGYECYEQIKTYKEIVGEIKAGSFSLLPPRDWFDSLEKQGVMFLNTSFTCEVGKANSHKEIWQEFSKELLSYIAEKRPDMIWFLWGKEAVSNKVYMDRGVFFESRHPMMCSVKYEEDFLKSDCFKKTWHLVQWVG